MPAAADDVPPPDEMASAVHDEALIDLPVPEDLPEPPPAAMAASAPSLPNTGAAPLAAISRLGDVDLQAVRLPPQSVESEQSVLGGLMLDNNAFDQVADVVTPEDFYRREHRLIYEKIAQMCSEGRPADIVTVYGELEAEDKAREGGGLA